MRFEHTALDPEPGRGFEHAAVQLCLFGPVNELQLCQILAQDQGGTGAIVGGDSSTDLGELVDYSTQEFPGDCRRRSLVLTQQLGLEAGDKVQIQQGVQALTDIQTEGSAGRTIDHQAV